MRSAMDDVTRPPLEAVKDEPVKDEPVKDETADESEPKAKPDDPAA
jgi:hypothetical protein